MIIKWDPTLNYLGILTLVSIVITLFGFLMTMVQIRSNTKIQRARFLLDTIELLFKDEQIQNAFVRIEQGKFHFNDECSDSPDVVAMDRLLYTFDAFGFLVRTGSITIHDASILSFRVLRAMDHPQMRAYLTYLDNLFEKQGAVVPSHPDARWLADKFKEGLPGKRKV